MASRIRKGDMVAIVSGDDKGKRGRVLRVLIDKDRLVVEGVNLVYKHMRKSQQSPQGGRVRREAAVHASNVMPVDPSTNKPTRVAYAVVDGRRVRVSRRSRTPLETARRAARTGTTSEASPRAGRPGAAPGKDQE